MTGSELDAIQDTKFLRGQFDRMLLKLVDARDGYLDYAAGPRNLYVLNRFLPYERTHAEFLTGLLIAAVCAILASWLGMARGDWLSRVRR